MGTPTRNSNNGRFGKVRTDEGKPDPRVFSVENPQPDPHHDVDPSRLSFDKPQAPSGQRLKHTATDVDKQIEEREAMRNRIIDEGAADEDLMLAANPMEELVDRYREPGMAYGFMSEHATRVLGRRGYVPVMDENGEAAKLGTLTLGKIPEKVFNARQRKAERESETRAAEMASEYAESVQRLQVQGRDLGLRVLQPNEIPMGNFVDTETGRNVRIG